MQSACGGGGDILPKCEKETIMTWYNLELRIHSLVMSFVVQVFNNDHFFMNMRGKINEHQSEHKDGEFAEHICPLKYIALKPKVEDGKFAPYKWGL